MNIPDFEEFLKGCEEFAKQEKRDDMIEICYRKSTKVLFMMLFFLTLTSLSNAADENKWRIEVNGGITAIHDTVFNGRFISIQGSRSLTPDNSVMLDFGFKWGYPRIAYAGWFVGIKYRFRSGKIISPFIYGGVAGLSEEGRPVWALNATAGIDINVTPRTVIPLAFQFGIHDSSQGPHVISIGIGYRF